MHDPAPPPHGAVGPVRRSVFGAVLALLSGFACTDGYPTQDAPEMDADKMSALERLDVMNQIGAEAHSKRHWQYVLGPACFLRVVARGEGRPRQELSIDLLGTRILTRHDAADGTYDVLATSVADESRSTDVTLLESLRWTDAVRMEWLLQVTQGNCRSGTLALQCTPGPGAAACGAAHST